MTSLPRALSVPAMVLLALAVAVPLFAQPLVIRNIKPDETVRNPVQPLASTPTDWPWLLRTAQTPSGETNEWFVLLKHGVSLADALEHLDLTSAIYISPLIDYETRETTGGRLTRANHPLLTALGVERGDRLISLNGEQITRTHELRAFVAANPWAPALELVLKRDEEPDPVTIRATIFYGPARDGMTVTVAPDDTMEALAEANYGDPRFYRLLVQANDRLRGELEPGMDLTLPDHPVLRYPAEEVSDGMWLIPAHEHATAIEQFPMLLRHARPAPARLPDGTAGLRLMGVNRNALPFRRGLKRGDVITSVNGVSLTSGEDLLAFYNDHRQDRFLDVRLRRGNRVLRLVYCLLPAPDVPAIDLLPPPTVAQPAEFGCERATDVEESLVAHSPFDSAIVWRVTRAQTRFLSHHFRALLDDAHAAPLIERMQSQLVFVGLEIRYADRDTLIEAYGFRAGDVIQAVRLDGGEWHPVRAAFELIEQFPADLEVETVDLRVRRANRPLLFRAILVPTPEGIAELPQAPPTGRAALAERDDTD